MEVKPMITRTVVVNDFHIPFNCSRSTELFFMVLDDLYAEGSVNKLLLNGDVLDLYCCNFYGKHPSVSIDMEDELYEGLKFFQDLRKRYPKLDITFLFGNHEHRYERWVIENAKPMHNKLRLEYELQLEQNEIEFYPYPYKYQIEKSNCYVMHSPPSYGVNGARTSLLLKNDESYIYGCSHRQQHATITGGSGKVYECFFNGWLGSVDETPDHAEVFGYRKGHASWQKCFSLVTVKDEAEAIINQISIRNHTCVVDGNYYEN
jgi:hypothetical protein